MNRMINLKETEIAFLKYFQQANYQLVDFNIIEKLDWQQLSLEAMQQMGERSFWQHNHQIYALRNDFTDQILRYYTKYPTQIDKVAYSGLIIRNNTTTTQLGIEHYRPTLPNVQCSIEHFMRFIKKYLNSDIQFVVMGHYQLIDLLLEEELQTPEILTMIAERNLSGLAKQLYPQHPMIQILKQPTQRQFEVLEQFINPKHDIYQQLLLWRQWLKGQDIQHIHLDLTIQPPRSYYKGLFIQCYLADNQSRILSGGYYSEGHIEGFGLGLTL